MKGLFKIILWIGIVVALCCTKAVAQDIQFSQFYQAQLYQNPAFAGAMHKDRAMFHQRLQWPSLQAKYITSLVSFDTYYKQYQSGYGMMIFYDQQGDGQISSMEISGQYAYELHINSQFSFRGGLQLGWNSRNIDYTRLTFPQQFDDSGFTGAANPYAGLKSRKTYFDIAAGGILYTTSYWIGVSAHHLNTPNQTFMDANADLPMKIALTGGYKFVIANEASGLANDNAITEISITPTAHYKLQGKSDQLDLGVYGHYKHYLAGGWYRGIPVKQFNAKLNNHESIVLLLGYKTYSMSLTYSYDFTVSTLSDADQGITGTGGSHELNITYIFGQKRWTKPTKRMPCPNFYVH